MFTFVPADIENLMAEYNKHVDRCVAIKAQVTEFMNEWMNQYDTSSVQPGELSEVFYQNVWCLPDALESNMEFIDKWCPKMPIEEVVIDGEFREIEEKEVTQHESGEATDE